MRTKDHTRALIPMHMEFLKRGTVKIELVFYSEFNNSVK
jgi:hypothetical protein